MGSGPVEMRNTFAPFWVDRDAGRIVGSFGIDEVGNNAVAFNPINPQNLPGLVPGAANVPAQELLTNWSATNEINTRFNRFWNSLEGQALRPNVHRYMDLRITPNGDGSTGPLDPTNLRFSKVQITPGSEVVYGPDQIPGPNYASQVRYTRVNGEPGPNQYRINYGDVPEPANYSLVFPGYANPPATYDPVSITSAILQPRFKVGYLQFCSDPNIPIPDTMRVRDANTGNLVIAPANIRVFYRFQFFESGPTTPNPGGATAVPDVVTVSYDTRQMMNVLLTIRNYPQSNLPEATSITLKATAKIRNTTQ